MEKIISIFEENAKVWNKPPPSNKSPPKNSLLQRGLFKDLRYINYTCKQHKITELLPNDQNTKDMPVGGVGHDTFPIGTKC